MTTNLPKNETTIIVLIASVILISSVLIASCSQRSKQQDQREQMLSQAIATEETNFFRQMGYFIPVTGENVQVLMSRINAKSDERSFVVSEMQSWSRGAVIPIITPTFVPAPPMPVPSINCAEILHRCNSGCRSWILLDDLDRIKQEGCFDDCNSDYRRCEANQR